MAIGPSLSDTIRCPAGQNLRPSGRSTHRFHIAAAGCPGGAGEAALSSLTFGALPLFRHAGQRAAADTTTTRVYLPALSRNARRRLLARMASGPDLVRGPVLKPPCSLQRPFRAWSLPRFHTAGARHGRPLRVRAPQRGRSARFIRGCLLRSLKAISYFQAITRAHDARAFF
jgi:hypothetical protein